MVLILVESSSSSYGPTLSNPNDKVRMIMGHDIPAQPKKPISKIPEVINVTAEIPKGSQNKYEYDKKSRS